MTPDEKFIIELHRRIDDEDLSINLLKKCLRAIERLVRQKQAVKDMVQAAKAMYESTGVSTELRDALESYDSLKRPMVGWRNLNLKTTVAYQEHQRMERERRRSEDAEE